VSVVEWAMLGVIVLGCIVCLGVGLDYVAKT